MPALLAIERRISPVTSLVSHVRESWSRVGRNLGERANLARDDVRTFFYHQKHPDQREVRVRGNQLVFPLPPEERPANDSSTEHIRMPLSSSLRKYLDEQL